MQEQVVAFELAGQIYALDIGIVREIIRLQPLMHIPEAPDFIAGVISLRSKVIPVIDLRCRFGLPGGEDAANSRIIILDLGGVTVGIKVDAVQEVLRLEGSEVEPVPPMAVGIDSAFLRGVGRWKDRLVLLLAGEKILKEQEKQSLEEGRLKIGA